MARLNTAVSISGGYSGAAAAGAAGSAASQGVGVATGIQEKFSWNGVALSALNAGVSAGISAKFGPAKGTNPSRMGDAVRSAAGSAVTQGIGVATGLQESFSWAGVAAAGSGAAVSNHAGRSGFVSGLGETAASVARGTASAIAHAATRSALDGSSFGDNIVAALPSVIGQTIGQGIAGNITKASNDAKRAMKMASMVSGSGSFSLENRGEMFFLDNDIGGGAASMSDEEVRNSQMYRALVGNRLPPSLAADIVRGDLHVSSDEAPWRLFFDEVDTNPAFDWLVQNQFFETYPVVADFYNFKYDIENMSVAEVSAIAEAHNVNFSELSSILLDGSSMFSERAAATFGAILSEPIIIGHDREFARIESDLRSYMVDSGLNERHVELLFNEMLDIGGFTDQAVNGFDNEYEYLKTAMAWTGALAATGGGPANNAIRSTANQLSSMAQLSARTGLRTGVKFSETAAVLVRGGSPTRRAVSYENEIRALYDSGATYSERQFTIRTASGIYNRVADDVVEIGGRPVAIDAKYVTDWARSISNPASAVGSRNFAAIVRNKIVAQAQDYGNTFDRVIYHTNSIDFASHYSQVFRDVGIDNIEFVITQARRN